MRCVVQRVSDAFVTSEGEETGRIGKGLMVLIGVSCEDTDKDVKYMAEKVPNLRIFEDENGKMNLSLADVGGSILAVSQFTLYGDARGGAGPASLPRPDLRRLTRSTSSWSAPGGTGASRWKPGVSAPTCRCI